MAVSASFWALIFFASALFYAIHQLVNAAGTIQQAVLCVDVQMDKRPGIG